MLKEDSYQKKVQVTFYCCKITKKIDEIHTVVSATSVLS